MAGLNPKQVAGYFAADLVEDGQLVGLGTGSTAFFAIERLGQRVAEGLKIQATATSIGTEQLARQWGIPLLSLSEIGSPDITIDGADEINPDLNLIKGGGGALFREKMVAMRSARMVVISDPSKLVYVLGAFPLPVEVVAFSHELTGKLLREAGADARLRHHPDGSLYLTDNGNVIYDCHFGEIHQPKELHIWLKMITGVVDTGLFIDLATEVIIGNPDGSVKRQSKPA